MNAVKWSSVWCAVFGAVLFVACATSPGSSYESDNEDGGSNADARSDVAPSSSDDGDGAAMDWTPYLKGELAVESRGCPACHQSTNPADGILSGQLTPVPGTHAFGANLTPDPDTGLGTLSDDEILLAIRGGVDDEGNALCNTMPRYPSVDDDEGASILAYLRGLIPVKRMIPASDCGDVADGGDDAAPNDAGVIAIDAGVGSKLDAGSCGGIVGPSVSASCHACEGRPCQANGCFNAYWCDTTTWICVPRPTGC